MIPELTLEEKANYIRNHYRDIFRSKDCFLYMSKRNIDLFLSRFLDKMTLDELSKKYNIPRSKVITVCKRIRDRLDENFPRFSYPKIENKFLTLEDLGIGCRSQNAICAKFNRYADLITLDELCMYTEKEIMSIAGLGKKGFNELKYALDLKNYSLKP